jgi:hypothetical protein
MTAINHIYWSELGQWTKLIMFVIFSCGVYAMGRLGDNEIRILDQH